MACARRADDAWSDDARASHDARTNDDARASHDAGANDDAWADDACCADAARADDARGADDAGPDDAWSTEPQLNAERADRQKRERETGDNAGCTATNGTEADTERDNCRKTGKRERGCEKDVERDWIRTGLCELDAISCKRLTLAVCVLVGTIQAEAAGCLLLMPSLVPSPRRMDL